MTTHAAPVLPGRLGSPDMQLRDDPRADPRMLAAMAPFGLDGVLPPTPVTSDSPDEEIYEHVAATEEGFGAVFAALFGDLPEIAGVESTTEIIRGVDGNDIQLYVHRPFSTGGAVPCVVHTHGGGMVLGAAADPNYERWPTAWPRLVWSWSASSSATGQASSATTRSPPA